MSQTMKVKELIPHPRNSEFFDDISGDAWEELKRSIEKSGIIEPLVITQDKVIVSGHQRRRACMELGIEDVQVEVRIFNSEDEILKALIDTNIRQRGIGNPNPIKFGKCLKELERIEGVRSGSAGKVATDLEPQIAVPKTQDDLAKELGLSVDKIQRYKKLADASPAIQDALNDGKITTSTALKIIRSLPEESQEELAKQLGVLEGKVTGKQVEELLQGIKDKSELINQLCEERDGLKNKMAEKDQQMDRLQDALEAEMSKTKETVTEYVEVVPEDYEDMKIELEAATKASDALGDLYEDQKAKHAKALEEVAALKKQLETKGGTSIAIDAQIYSAVVITKCNGFMKETQPYILDMDEMDELSKRDLIAYEGALSCLKDWLETVVEGIDDYMNTLEGSEGQKHE